MKQRKWDSKTKLRAVLEGLKGRSVAEICNSYQIQPSQYHQWKDRFLSNAESAFESKRTPSKEMRLLEENKALKALVGALTLELKKSEEEF
ncbi:MAG: transposase [Chlamydiia bacterium]|nr:transposase [Chlamydiia bacterium]